MKPISDAADEFFSQKKQEINACKSLALLDGMVQRILGYKDETVSRMEAMSRPVQEQAKPTETKRKVYKQVIRQVLFPSKKLESQEDIDAYVAKVKEQLERLIEGSDGVEIK